MRASLASQVFMSGKCHIPGEIERYCSEVLTILVTPAIGDMNLKMRLNRDTAPRI